MCCSAARGMLRCIHSLVLPCPGRSRSACVCSSMTVLRNGVSPMPFPRGGRFAGLVSLASAAAAAALLAYGAERCCLCSHY